MKTQRKALLVILLISLILSVLWLVEQYRAPQQYSDVFFGSTSPLPVLYREWSACADRQWPVGLAAA